jgi:hypothetical protein
LRIDFVVKNYISGQTTPETEVNESFLSSSSLSVSFSSPSGSLIIPVNIFYKGVSSPSSELELEPEESPTQLEATGMNINNNNNNNKRNATTPLATSSKNPNKYDDLDYIYRNLYLNLDSTIAHPLDDYTTKEFASVFQQVTHYMVDRPCQARSGWNHAQYPRYITGTDRRTVRAQTVSDCFKAFNARYAVEYLFFAQILALCRPINVTNPIRQLYTLLYSTYSCLIGLVKLIGGHSAMNFAKSLIVSGKNYFNHCAPMQKNGSFWPKILPSSLMD